MSILWIIYFAIGIILALCVIYMAINDKEALDFEIDINKAAHNKLGTILLFIIILVFALIMVILWPVALLYCYFKIKNKEK